MIVRLYSDLHLEIAGWEPPPIAADLVILAGDIGSHTHGLDWAARRFDCPVAYVAGNHEYYDAHLGLIREMRRVGHPGVHFLEQEVLAVGDTRILGCTLWSGFSLLGTEHQAHYMGVAGRSINDFRLIHASGGRRLAPEDALHLHRVAAAWLDRALAQPFDGRTVVVTHFVPHPGCVAIQHQGNPLSPYFVTDMRYLMRRHRIDLWCYGHSHTNINLVDKSGCRVVANQRGYPGEKIGFRDDGVIEL